MKNGKFLNENIPFVNWFGVVNNILYFIVWQLIPKVEQQCYMNRSDKAWCHLNHNAEWKSFNYSIKAILIVEKVNVGAWILQNYWNKLIFFI